MAVRYAALCACLKVNVCHCNSLGGATWRSIMGRTDRQTERRNMRPPPREEGRIITLIGTCRYYIDMIVMFWSGFINVLSLAFCQWQGGCFHSCLLTGLFKNVWPNLSEILRYGWTRSRDQLIRFERPWPKVQVTRGQKVEIVFLNNSAQNCRRQSQRN